MHLENRTKGPLRSDWRRDCRSDGVRRGGADKRDNRGEIGCVAKRFTNGRAALQATLSGFRKRHRIVNGRSPSRATLRPPIHRHDESLWSPARTEYDRATMPRQLLGGTGEEAFGFRFLGDTEGYGSAQFGEATKNALEQLTQMVGNGKTVNNVFGEGANPRLRALRDGKRSSGFPRICWSTECKNRFTASRYLNGIAYATNCSEYMNAVRVCVQGRQNGCQGDLPLLFQRWALPRILRPGTIDNIARHNLVYPIRHGARLTLPEADVDQPGLFGEA